MKNKALTFSKKLKDQISKVFVKKEEAVHSMVIAFLAGLHVLIEDIPGVGKTTLARTLAKSAGLDFGRIQFTPDLLPGDILGMTVWSVEKRDFIFKQGAIMHQFILADEINRASARTQSSLLEAMQEGSVTVDDKTYILPEPFFVIATQNPSSFAGTFQLPEAQVDRFGISFSLGYPDPEEEITILERFKETDPLKDLNTVINSKEIMSIRNDIRKVHADKKIKNFIVAIAGATRQSTLIKLGMSPRATQHLLLASQTEALLNGKDYIVPENILKIVSNVLSHRLILSAEARIKNLTTKDAIKKILSEIPIPSGL